MHKNPLYSSSVKDLTTSQLNPKPLQSASTISVKENPIKDTYILNQIEMINKFYQVDSNQISNDAICPKPDIKKFNKSLTSSSTSISNNSSFNSEHNNSINLPKSKTPQQKKPTVPEIPALHISSLKTPEKSIPPLPILSKKVTQRIQMDHEILDKSADDICNNTASTHRANDLRNFIEMLLVRSPSKDDKTPRNVNESIMKGPSGSKSIGNHSESHKSLVKFDYTAYSNENNVDDATENYNSSLEEEDPDEGKSKYYSHHDISDIELGYTKRQSTAYYDDVKRTLNFDEDTENPTEDESEARALNENKFMFENSTSTPTKSRNPGTKDVSKYLNSQALNKRNTKGSQRNTSAQQITSTNKIRVLKKVKATSKGNNSISNLSSSRSHSMISLTTSCSSNGAQQKLNEISKESLNKSTKNVKQRVWK